MGTGNMVVHRLLKALQLTTHYTKVVLYDCHRLTSSHSCHWSFHCLLLLLASLLLELKNSQNRTSEQDLRC